MSSEKQFQPTTVADRPHGAKRTIIIAVDNSDHSKYAFKWSLDNVVRANGEDWVLLLGCINDKCKSVEISLDANKSLDDVEKAEQSRLKNMFGTFTSELSKKMISSKSIVMKGDPKISLVSKSADMHADILIMGSRGMGMVKKAILGSVSDYCVNNALCPVLIVRKPGVGAV